mmetsp:Transcript_83031/g.130993  ORF Transcript_83031/g.130993 Transcript_83031/m.130993 type:complete len:92 (+) Transcript_83031:356-631(+)
MQSLTAPITFITVTARQSENYPSEPKASRWFRARSVPVPKNGCENSQDVSIKTSIIQNWHEFRIDQLYRYMYFATSSESRGAKKLPSIHCI